MPDYCQHEIEKTDMSGSNLRVCRKCRRLGRFEGVTGMVEWESKAAFEELYNNVRMGRLNLNSQRALGDFCESLLPPM